VQQNGNAAPAPVSSNRDSRSVPRVLIIGAGVGGLCMAIQLKRAGFANFAVLEKADGVGGTWHDNSYPGACCDVPSHLYSFSFEHKSDWSRKFAPQSEILDYLNHCADKYGIRPHVRFGTEVVAARYDEAAQLWRVRTRGGEELEAEVLVSAVGQLNRPAYPDIPGREEFAGVSFHSARWRHDHDLTGRTVGVIGNAASAIQFIPPVAERAARLHVFQRSPNWMARRRDRAYGERERRRFARHPHLAKLYRWSIWARLEAFWPVFARGNRFAPLVQGMCLKELKEQVRDARLRKVLTPDFPVGCKRLLISDDYFAALNRDNVEVVTTPIERITARGVLTADGVTRELDTLVYGTGFESTRFLMPMEIRGRGGRELHDAWRSGAEAYLGLCVAGFPNFFILYGPNTNLGHNSIIFMIECQVGYVLQCLRALEERRLGAVEVVANAMDRYNVEVQRRLAQTVWSDDCQSWYKNSAGRITNNWAYSTTTYWWRTRRPNLDDFRLEPRLS